ncbi:MAG: hypothetical protein EZS28_046420, partial [Streblomastix strix]
SLGYTKVQVTSFGIAGGVGEEDDRNVKLAVQQIIDLFETLRYGKSFLKNSKKKGAWKKLIRIQYLMITKSIST